jgi:hypothetical protein
MVTPATDVLAVSIFQDCIQTHNIALKSCVGTQHTRDAEAEMACEREKEASTQKIHRMGVKVMKWKCV